MEFQIMKHENFRIKENYCQGKMKTAIGSVQRE